QGRLTDGKGKTIDCRDAIFIMTSNVGSEEIAQHALQLRQEALDLSKKRLADNLGTSNPSPTPVSRSSDLPEKSPSPPLSSHGSRSLSSSSCSPAMDPDPSLAPPALQPWIQIPLQLLLHLPMSGSRLWDGISRWIKGLGWDLQVDQGSGIGSPGGSGVLGWFLQVERRVVNQLAAAYEQDLLPRGCTLRIAVEDSDKQLLKPEGDASRASERAKAPSLRLEIVEQGSRARRLDIQAPLNPENISCLL
ncbi:CLPB protein, partial [Piaya cayana]|nr:CLPB protein [Piaya cayana]